MDANIYSACTLFNPIKLGQDLNLFSMLHYSKFFVRCLIFNSYNEKSPIISDRGFMISPSLKLRRMKLATTYFTRRSLAKSGSPAWYCGTISAVRLIRLWRIGMGRGGRKKYF